MNETEQLLVSLCLLAKENKLLQCTYKSDGIEISFQMDQSMWEDIEQPKELTEEQLDDMQEKEDKESMFFCSG